MFTDHDPAVLEDLYEQLGNKKELVIEYLLNGQISERVLDQINQRQERNQQQDQVARQERHRRPKNNGQAARGAPGGRPDQRQRQRGQAASGQRALNSSGEYYLEEEQQSEGGGGEDKDAMLARQLQEREYDIARRNQQKIEEQKRREKEILRQNGRQNSHQRQSSNSQLQLSQLRGSAAANRSHLRDSEGRGSIPSVYELNNQGHGEKVFDSDEMDTAHRALKKAEQRDAHKNGMPDKKNIKKNDGAAEENPGFFSLFCGCFAANKNKKQKNQNNIINGQMDPSGGSAALQQNPRAQQYRIDIDHEQLDREFDV